jgi:hypothetical protein
MSDRPNSSQEGSAGDRRAPDGIQLPMRRREMMALSAGALASAALYAAVPGKVTRPDPWRAAGDRPHRTAC